MTPLKQLKHTKGNIYLTKSNKDVLYDHCNDFYFIFDVDIKKRWTKDEGTAYAPPTWEANDIVEIYNLKVYADVTDEIMVLSESEIDEIEKELLTKIEID